MSALYDAIASEKADVHKNQTVSSDHRDIPELPKHLLGRLLRRLSVAEMQFALRHKLLPVAWLPHLTLFAAVDGLGEQSAADMDLRPVAHITAHNFQIAVRQILGPKILCHAVYHLRQKNPKYSAHKRITLPQLLWLVIAGAVYLCGLAMLPIDTSLALTCIFLSMFFLSIVALRLMCVLNPHQKKSIKINRADDHELPTYSVLVPLFRETGVIHQLVSALDHLDYPALCIKRTKII